MLSQHRQLITRLVSGLSSEQLTWTPPAASNNILWNLGHIIAVQQLLHYRLAGLEPLAPKELIAQCKPGSSPSEWTQSPDPDELKVLLLELPERFEKDYAAGRFSTYSPYTTSTGVTLSSIDDAVAFNHFHEGLHAGIILSYKKQQGVSALLADA